MSNIEKAQKEAIDLYEELKVSRCPVCKVNGKLGVNWNRFHDFEISHIILLDNLGVLSFSTVDTYIWLSWNGLVLNPRFSSGSVAYFTSRLYAIGWAEAHATGRNATLLKVDSR